MRRKVRENGRKIGKHSGVTEHDKADHENIKVYDVFKK